LGVTTCNFLRRSDRWTALRTRLPTLRCCSASSCSFFITNDVTDAAAGTTLPSGPTALPSGPTALPSGPTALPSWRWPGRAVGGGYERRWRGRKCQRAAGNDGRLVSPALSASEPFFLRRTHLRTEPLHTNLCIHEYVNTISLHTHMPTYIQAQIQMCIHNV